MIIKLTAQNFKRLEAIEIEPNENMNIISGKNAQGKSSVLDAIMFGFAGPSREIPKPIKDGKDKARIEIETENFIITRVITPSGQKLTVTGKDGKETSSPQKFLDTLFNSVAIDPVRFTMLDSKDQVRTLIVSLGLDQELKKLDEERSNYYTERTVVNRRIKDLDGILKKYRDSYPSGEIESASDVSTQLQKAIETNQAINQDKLDLNNIGEEGKAVKLKIAANFDEIERLMNENASFQLKLDELKIQYKTLAEKISNAEVVDTNVLQEKLSNLEEQNSLIRERMEKDKYTTEKIEADKETKKLTEKIEEVDTKKIDLVKNSSIGLPLEIREDELFYRGNPLKQCSSAEQIKVSTAIAMKLQPDMKVIIIREGSLLDVESLNSLGKIAEKYGFQLWIEKVDETGTVGIVIEEGKVKE